MANPSKIKIPRAPDRVVFDAFAEATRNHPNTAINIVAFGDTSLGNVSPIGDTHGEAVDFLLNENGTAIDRMSFHIKGFSVNYYRGGFDHNNQHHKSGVYDEIHFSFNTNQQPPHLTEIEKIQTISLLTKKLNAFVPNRTASVGLSDDDVQAESIHITIMERLEQLNIELVQKTDDYRQRLDDDFHKKALTLEEQVEKKQETLDAEHKKKTEAIEAIKQLLERKLKEVDDRDNTHVRRELRKDLQSEIKNRQTAFNLTAGTKKLRLPIHLFCVFTIITLFVLAYLQGQQLVNVLTLPAETHHPTSLSILIMMALKSIGITASAIGFTIFYIKWMNKWLEQHSQAEFQLKQFQLDVDRASWAVETTLAWKSEVKDVIPSTLLESITRNLFTNESKLFDTPLHPADQLASALLGTASSVRLKAGDAEIELDGKKLKKQLSDKKEKPSTT